ncbi:MAG TPA: hypothetical protein PKY87_17470, partial [Terricaulis sp.]|nr:hypothetical protein [Terricaulis sp.]
LPDHEPESAAFVLRSRGALALGAYRHAAACVAGLIARDAPTRVCVRDADAPGAPVLTFSMRLEGRETITTLLEGH